MKALIREFFQSLKERGQLDEILPEILAETGFSVFSRPGRGTTQHGVDVAATKKSASGEDEVFLFTIKPGNLDRGTWDGTEQAVRSSLNEIIDVYIPTKLPAEFANAKVKVCICVGGEIKETVRTQVSQFEQKATTERVSFEEWNGDRLADVMLDNVLGETIVPETFRASLRKALALVDEPDVSFQHFAHFLRLVGEQPTSSDKGRLTALRQMYLGLWILYGWCQLANNLESAYRSSELTLLRGWDMLKHHFKPGGKPPKLETGLLDGLIRLHVLIASDLVESRIIPHVKSRHALSVAVGSQSPVDVNLKLFESLARVSLLGHWLLYIAERSEAEVAEAARKRSRELLHSAFAMIENNPTLFLPVSDRQVTAIGMLLMLALTDPTSHGDVRRWLSEMARRYDFSIQGQMRYPSVAWDYHELIDHPKLNDEDYFKAATAGSVALPVLYMWLAALGQKKEVELLRELKREKLEHCTLQLWFPDATSEKHLYLHDEQHGVSLTDIELDQDSDGMIRRISEEATRQTGFEELSAIRLGVWPIVLTACNHYHLPIPPQFWIMSLLPPEQGEQSESAAKGAAEGSPSAEPQ